MISIENSLLLLLQLYNRGTIHDWIFFCLFREMQAEYEQKISEWGALEAIVLQQDREITAANIAR